MKKLSAFAVALTLTFVVVAVTLLWGPERQLAAPLPEATLINGAGATFPYPIYSKWFDEYRKLHPDIRRLPTELTCRSCVQPIFCRSQNLCSTALQLLGSLVQKAP